MDQAEGSIGNSDYITVIIKFGGHWVTVRNQTRKRYVDGRQKTVTYELQKFSYFTLRAEVMNLCSWDERQLFQMHYHIPGTSPKEYMLIGDVDAVESIRMHSCRSTPIEVVVDGHNSFAGYREDDHLFPSDTFAQCAIVSSESSIRPGDDSLLVGSRFDSAHAFKQALRTESIKNNCSIKITSSNRSRVLASCSYSACQWKIRGVLCSDGHTFEVKKLYGIHSCPGINRAGNNLATAEWVAEEIRDLVKHQPTVPPREIRSRLEASYGLTLPYMKLWRSRELARSSLFFQR